MATTTFEFEKTKDRPLHEQVCEHLRQQYGGQQSDVALPALRQLSESLGVNHITVSRALRRLESEGLLRIIPGKGTFVAKPRSDHHAVELVTFYTRAFHMADTSRHILGGMQSGLSGENTLAGSTLLVPPVPHPSTFLQSLEARQVAAVAFFGFGYLPYPDSFEETRLLHELADNIPVVLIGKEHPLLKLDCVFCDPVPQMLVFLEECYARGLRRFDYFGSTDNQTHLRHRAAAFEDFLLSHGLTWKRTTGNRDWSDQELVAKLLDGEPEVVVASIPARAQTLLVEAHRRGVKPEADLEILCFSGSVDEIRSIAPYVNVVLLEEEEVGRCVIHRIQGRLDGSEKMPPLTRRVPGKLVRRGKIKA